MKRYFLLGLAALGVVGLAPTVSKADDGFRVYIDPGYQQYRPYYYGEDSRRYRYYRYSEESRWNRWHHRHDYDQDNCDRHYYDGDDD